MHKYLIAFLVTLEELVPPPASCHHAIMRVTYGEGADVSPKLAVQVNDTGAFYTFFLDASDLALPAAELAAEVARIHRSQCDRQNLQVETSMGEFSRSGE